MSADRFEIHDHGSKLTVRDTKYGSEVSMLRVRSYSRELTVMAGAIRQQARDIAALKDTLADEVTANEAFRSKTCSRRSLQGCRPNRKSTNGWRNCRSEFLGSPPSGRMGSLPPSSEHGERHVRGGEGYGLR